MNPRVSSVQDDNCVVPITPFPNSLIQTPGTDVWARNGSRQEAITTEIAQTSILNEHGAHRSNLPTCTEYFGAEFVRNPDGTPLLDHENKPITIAKMLATKPLRSELHSRPGPGNRKLTYLSGESVTRTLNDIFGFDGWCLEVKETRRESCEKDSKERYCVSYTSLVRVTHRQSGAFKEDCGAGDAMDRNLGTAISHALKASVTDAMKRAVRHFGDKLGNSLYESSFNMNNAPKSLKDALIMYDIERAKCKFGFDKDRVKLETQSEQVQGECQLAVGTEVVPQTVMSSTVDVNLSKIGLNQVPSVTSSTKIIKSTTDHAPIIGATTATLGHDSSHRTLEKRGNDFCHKSCDDTNNNKRYVNYQTINSYKPSLPSNHNTTSVTTSPGIVVSNTKSNHEVSRQLSSTNPMSSNSFAKKVDLAHQISNKSPNGLKRFQTNSNLPRKSPVNNVNESLQPLPPATSKIPLTDMTSFNRTLSNENKISVPNMNGMKRPVDDQENHVLPVSKKVTSYNGLNPYTVGKK